MSRSIGQFLVELLAVNEIDTVFGIPGVHNLELYRGLAAACGMKHVLMRHEQGAGFAADGYARLSGRPAACFVISGPGMTNILTAASQAYTDSIPLLVVASAPTSTSQGKQWGVLHELHDQTALASGVFGVARAARTAEDVRDHLRLCLASLRTGRPRPAYLEIPLDLLSQGTTLDALRFEGAALLPQADQDQVDAALRLLAVAARPVVIAGGGARAAGAELQRLIATLDCPLFLTTAAKGVLPEAHPANFGASLPYPAAQQLIADADVVLAVGTEIAETDLFYSTKLAMSGLLIRIDIDPVKLADHYAADVCIWADARSALCMLNQSLAGRLQNLSTGGAQSAAAAAPSTRRGWCTSLGGSAQFRAAIDSSFDDKSRAMAGALRAIKAALPWDAVVFTDMTQIAYLGNYAFAVDGPGQWFHPSGYGTLGYALPAALGAKLAAPARAVVALAGDFGVQFTLNELMTAVEAGQSLPLVVWNNGALGQIRDDMIAAGIPAIGVVARNPDFVALAKACGARAVRVSVAAALTESLRNALHAPGPTLIEIDAGSFH
jgi:thiamine pyrophosphate-dependent acetolactate synthase large subunit-like protein